MSPETTRILLFLAPLAIGGIIAIANSDDVNEISEKVEAWKSLHLYGRLQYWGY